MMTAMAKAPPAAPPAMAAVGTFDSFWTGTAAGELSALLPVLGPGAPLEVKDGLEDKVGLLVGD